MNNYVYGYTPIGRLDTKNPPNGGSGVILSNPHFYKEKEKYETKISEPVLYKIEVINVSKI